MSEAPGPSPARRAARRARLTRLRRWAHVLIVPSLAAAMIAPDAPSAVLAAMFGGAAVVAVWLDRFASQRLRDALGGSRLVRAADLTLWNLALIVLGLEVGLVVASQVVSSPLLTPPNAKSYQRVRDFRFGPYAPYLGGRTNARGFHDTDWAVPKPPGTFRIAALGDSFHFGIVPYDQTALTLVEAQLSSRLGAPIEVCNLGVAGTSPIDYLFVLNDEARLLEPDLVLVGLYVGNDIGVTRAGSRLRPANWMVHALAYRLLRIAQERARGSPASAGQAGVRQVGNPMSPEGYLERVVEEYLPLLPAERSPADDRRWADTLGLVEQIGALAGGQYAVALYPCEAQVDPALLERACARIGRPVGDFDVRRPGQRFMAHFQARGVPACDLLPAFEARRSEGRAYEENDSHWNTLGNRIAADALTDFLEPIVRAHLNGATPRKEGDE